MGCTLVPWHTPKPATSEGRVIRALFEAVFEMPPVRITAKVLRPVPINLLEVKAVFDRMDRSEQRNRAYPGTPELVFIRARPGSPFPVRFGTFRSIPSYSELFRAIPS